MSLAQMAKVSCAVQKFRAAHLPYISIFQEPTYGGVSASYAMQGDIRIGIRFVSNRSSHVTISLLHYRNARIGFAGPNVILNTIFNQKQSAYDAACPRGFQSAPFVQDHGQLDIVLDNEGWPPTLPLTHSHRVFVICSCCSAHGRAHSVDPLRPAPERYREARRSGAPSSPDRSGVLARILTNPIAVTTPHTLTDSRQPLGADRVTAASWRRPCQGLPACARPFSLPTTGHDQYHLHKLH